MRVILMVLDSVGIGGAEDAQSYGDYGSNTLVNIKKAEKDMVLKNMLQLGLGHIDGGELLKGGKIITPTGSYGKMAEVSKGKDTTTGHWEIAGLHIDTPFPTYPQGFPREIIDKFEAITGKKTLGNCTASGTQIIMDLGDEHVRTGNFILYTSADSVFQIAAHEDIVPLAELYDICEKCRAMLIGEHAVSRVIARPFTGLSGQYVRTMGRRDFSLKPFHKTMLDYIKEDGKTVAAVGKIDDIFLGQGVTKAVHTKNNMEGVDATLAYMDQVEQGLIFTNLVDFDMVYGHRNDIKGYAKALMEFDERLPEIIGKLRDDDILLITADHGCDPTMPGTDHSRENIPLLIYGKNVKPGVNLKTRTSFSDIAKSVLDYLGVRGDVKGISFMDEIRIK